MKELPDKDRTSLVFTSLEIELAKKRIDDLGRTEAQKQEDTLVRAGQIAAAFDQPIPAPPPPEPEKIKVKTNEELDVLTDDQRSKYYTTLPLDVRKSVKTPFRSFRSKKMWAAMSPEERVEQRKRLGRRKHTQKDEIKEKGAPDG